MKHGWEIISKVTASDCNLIRKIRQVNVWKGRLMSSDLIKTLSGGI